LLEGSVILEKRGSTTVSNSEWRVQVKVFESKTPSREGKMYINGAIEKYASNLSPKLFVSYQSQMYNHIWVISDHSDDFFNEIVWSKDVFLKCASSVSLLSSYFLKNPSHIYNFQESFPYSSTGDEYSFLIQHVPNFNWSLLEKSEIASTVFPIKLAGKFF
jgi:hypothetical protein